MASNTAHLRFINAALDESALRGGSIVLRGVLDPKTLQALKADDYQREQLHITPRSSLWRALQDGARFPDIELGVRSSTYDGKGSTFTIKDDVYIIDGLQRVTACMKWLQEHGEGNVHLGAVLHFGTTKDWERDRFRVLNASRQKVSPSVLLRNERETYPAVNVIFGLTTTDKSFVLYNRVCWQQKMARHELITALNLVKAVTQLHHHQVSAAKTSLSTLIPVIVKQVDVIGTKIYRDNIKTFWEVMDECWGVRLAQYQGAPHLRATFMRVLSRVFSDHHDFWVSPAEHRFFVSAEMRKKLAGIRTNDPTISSLAGSGGKAPHLLYSLIRDHINSGKRTKHLKSRNPSGGIDLDDEVEAEVAA